MIAIHEIADPAELCSEQLRHRAVHARKANSRQLIAAIDGFEVGYASIDHRPEINAGVVYEIFVLPKHRLKQIGTRLLSAAEKTIRELGCSNAFVSARPLESTIDEARLFRWYESAGYELVSNTGEHTKRLA